MTNSSPPSNGSALKRLSRPLALTAGAVAALSLAACGGGGGSNPPVVTAPPPPVPPPPSPPPPPTGDVNVSGTASFERPSVRPSNGSLDFTNLQTLPIRSAVVEAVNGAGTVLATGLTDEAGAYSLDVPAGTDLRIQIVSRTVDDDGPAEWDLGVADNTNGNALYVLQGSLADSGGADSTRNLLARTGANTSGAYTGPRAAAPFAILDDAYSAIQTVVAVDADANLPPIQMRWSENNRAASGDATRGEIGTSSYVTTVNDRAVFVLGDAGVDTDEFDSSVVVHEWGHYFEDQIARSDSVGGPHSLADRLDPRVSMGEGFGNAVSGIVLGRDFYADSLGNNAAQGFAFSLENGRAQGGFYSEDSLQSIIFDIADSNDDAADTISGGFGPIYDALTDPAYVNGDGYTTVYSFAEAVRRTRPALTAQIDALLTEESIAVTDAFGTGETVDGGVDEALPLYRTLTTGGSVDFCSVDDAGDVNKLGNRQYIRYSKAADGAVTLTMTRTSGPATSDPDFVIQRAGDFVTAGRSEVDNSETLTTNLAAGEYLIDAYEFNNVDFGNPNQGDYCFTLTAN